MTAGRNILSIKKDWGTPKIYVDVVKEMFGGIIDLDPCSNDYSIVNAETEFKLPVEDGLKKIWNFKRIYVNPPYGIDKQNHTRIDNWLAKCADANIKFNSEVLALIPVATNTGHWKRNVFGKAKAICFLSDTRLKFLINGNIGGKGSPMSCAMVYWGSNFDRFYSIFHKFGAVVNISHLTIVQTTKEKEGIS